MTLKTSVVILCLLCSCPAGAQKRSALVNFRHLEHLTERIQLSGEAVDIVHIYSNYPDYSWVSAQESGPEGIACVDDAARAAVLYLRAYEAWSDRASLRRATTLLRFVLDMQTPDGEFYNFLFADHSINREGRTSYKSFGWWAARGVWAMGLGFRILRDKDAGLSARLRVGMERCLPHVDSLLAKHGRVRSLAGYRVPEWLLYGSGTDATPELVLGLTEFYAATLDTAVGRRIRELADGIMMMQDGNGSRYPYGLHRSWETQWHMWGSAQTEALACAGRILKSDTMIASAEREARGWFSRLLIQGFCKEMDIGTPGAPVTRFEQIAYGVSPITVGLIRVSEATGKTEYLKMAGLFSSWFFGDNVLRKPLYDPLTGLAYDGIRDSVTINLNSGAESTIETLLALLAVERSPLAAEYLSYRKLASGKRGELLFAVFRNDAGGQIAITVDGRSGEMKVLEGEECESLVREAVR